MKIQTPLVDIKDQLINFISEGFAIIGYAFQSSQDQNGVSVMAQDWTNRVHAYLYSTFPTNKEDGQFLHTPGLGLLYTGMDSVVNNVINAIDRKLKVLEIILDNLEKYYQFEPEKIRLYIEGIDSFSQVRGVNHHEIEGFLESGFFKRSETAIKQAFAQIIGESFVPNDHGGETEDLYTSRIWLNGDRVQTSIILNGPGKVSAKETRMKDLGASNQLERMMRTDSSKLYIVQSVKPVGQDIVNTFEAFLKDQRSKGNHCYYCIIDGQDTATILYAYGFLP